MSFLLDMGESMIHIQSEPQAPAPGVFGFQFTLNCSGRFRRAMRVEDTGRLRSPLGFSDLALCLTYLVDGMMCRSIWVNEPIPISNPRSMADGLSLRRSLCV